MTAFDVTHVRDLVVAQALWRLGLLRSDQLPNVAASLLESGLDTRNLRVLAVTEPQASYEASDLFEAILRGLHAERMSKRDAAMAYAKHIAAQIVSNDLDPLRGAALIAEAALCVDEPTFHDLDPFTYAASEFESRPQDREVFSGGVTVEACNLLAR